jgi:ubiquinone/menaquinone biosynthesis C-methylase UbiE
MEESVAGRDLSDKNAIPYLPFATLGEYVCRVKSQYAHLGSVLDFDRPGADEALTALSGVTTEFDSDETGRGDTYRAAQTDASVRWTGMRQLLRLASPDRRPMIMLDVLGGDGTVARAARGSADAWHREMRVLTGDLSGAMVEHALDNGLAAVRQAADFLFLKENAVDAVLLAYGTHHIAPKHRPLAIAEALRVVRPGGRVVLHDFAENSPMTRFFGDVVHQYSKAGHDYEHFSRAGLAGLFRDAGLAVSITDIYDPLITCAENQNEARGRMCRYIANMYGVGSWMSAHHGLEDSWQQLIRYFDHSGQLGPRLDGNDVPVIPSTRRTDSGFVAVVPRVALVAVAQKAGRDGITG